MTAIAARRTESSPEPASEPVGCRVLAVDYGRKRIGLAVADEAGGVARPLATIERKNRREDMRRLKEIVREHGMKQIVVGHPLRLDGTRGEMALEAERFAERLRKQIGVPVELVDERLTSWEAGQVLEEREGRKSFTQRAQRPHRAHRGSAKRTREAKESVDAVAAAVILRDYLERKKTQERT